MNAGAIRLFRQVDSQDSQQRRGLERLGQVNATVRLAQGGGDDDDDLDRPSVAGMFRRAARNDGSRTGNT